MSLAVQEHPAAADLVALDRYPIHDLGGERGRTLLADSRAQLDATNGCNFPGFVRPEAAAALAREAAPWTAGAYEKSSKRNPYSGVDDPSRPADHPVRRFLTYATLQLAYDQIPSTSQIDRLYRWDVLTRFIAAVLGHEVLYRMADPFQALNLIWQRPGESSPPHFDHNDFTVSLLLEASQAGGEFEFAPDLRTRDDEHFDEVQRVLDGDRSRVQRMRREPGTLTIFRGRDSLHWVTPVRAGRRASAIMCYDQRPDCIDSDEVNLLVYGPRIRSLLASW